jgi:hypothetical protein
LSAEIDKVRSAIQGKVASIEKAKEEKRLK